jgi:hypothetical protein
MHDVHDDVLSEPDGSLYVDDTTNEGRIFDGRLTYNKGNSVVHMLRFIAPNDNAFFTLLKDYQSQFAFSTAVTADFEDLAEQVYGQNLDTFFDQWVYKEGFPVYDATWYQSGNNVTVQLVQNTSMPSSVATFSTPIELKLKSPQGDTIVKVYNNQYVNSYSFTWNKPMNGMEVDPAEWLLREVNSVTQDPTLAVKGLVNSNVRVFPNPTSDLWKVSGLSTGTSIVLSDLSGRILYSAQVAASSVEVPACSYAPGIYLLQMTDAKGNISNLKLSKQ